MQGVTVALGLLACGAAAWGMASLDKNILPALNARIDSMQEFPSKVVQQVASLANETAALSQPLSNISTIISSIDAVGIREDLQHVTAFLKEAPSPTALKATLQQLSSALKPQLYEGLRQLHAQVNVASDSSPLAALKGYLDTLADFDISTMGPAISRYNDALAALFDIIVSDRWVGAAGASRALVTNVPYAPSIAELVVLARRQHGQPNPEGSSLHIQPSHSNITPAAQQAAWHGGRAANSTEADCVSTAKQLSLTFGEGIPKGTPCLLNLLSHPHLLLSQEQC